MSDRPRLLVLGSSPAWSNAGEACSGYLVEAGAVRIALDLGTGSLASLRLRDPAPIAAIVLSHLHFDHIADLVPLAYAVTIGSLGDWPRIALWVPPGGRDRMAVLALAAGAEESLIGDALDLGEYDPQVGLEIGGSRLGFAAVDHPGHCFAIRVEAAGGALCYSGDTSTVESFCDLARGADVLLCEATGADSEPTDSVHLSAAQAAEAAVAAGARHLVLAHLAAERRPAALLAAQAVFEGTVELAVPGLRVET